MKRTYGIADLRVRDAIATRVASGLLWGYSGDTSSGQSTRLQKVMVNNVLPSEIISDRMPLVNRLVRSAHEIRNTYRLGWCYTQNYRGNHLSIKNASAAMKALWKVNVPPKRKTRGR